MVSFSSNTSCSVKNGFDWQNKKPGKSPDISQFRAQLDLLNLQIVQVTADGNCFFRSGIIRWMPLVLVENHILIVTTRGYSWGDVIFSWWFHVYIYIYCIMHIALNFWDIHSSLLQMVCMLINWCLMVMFSRDFLFGLCLI